MYLHHDHVTVGRLELCERLCNQLNIQRTISTASRPQTDGQTERVQRTFEQMVRRNIQPDEYEWERLLPALELACNTSSHSSTKLSPFEVMIRENPIPAAELNIMGDPAPAVIPPMCKLFRRLFDRAEGYILKASWEQKACANTHRRDAEFQPADPRQVSGFGDAFDCQNVFHVFQLIPDRSRDSAMKSRDTVVGRLPARDIHENFTRCYETGAKLRSRTHVRSIFAKGAQLLLFENKDFLSASGNNNRGDRYIEMSGDSLSPASSPPPEKADLKDETPGEATHEQPSSSSWWSFGLVSAAAAAAAAVTGGGATNAGTSPDEASGDDVPAAEGAPESEGEAVEAAEEDEGGATVRFHPEATEGGKGTGRRRRVQEDAVANMGFVELVENLLLTHDSSNRRGFRSSSLGSIVTEVSSEPDSDADSGYLREEQEDEEPESWEWEAEEISAFASQIHAKMCQQLEQEAAFVEMGFKRGIALMTGALAIEDDTKMLLHEGRLAGLGLTPLDDETDADMQKIDLGMLLTLTPENYGGRLLGPSGVSDRLRSPLFKMHRELTRLGSTSSEDSISESETDHSSSNNSSSGNTVEATKTTV
ncbi:LOW QUALITY PROTEIN: uncharacterized protein EMH_0050910 [Eimeria mitis]|uniref:Integrase catalytic domain-containing protein n=1 Tax=Eimeria mitis TaxID=44415 RepID=U6K8B4_9EIME|nr:LOW QUALITY PROTEIN: uncharacterized protein EMH_0050910 [Eimeria mitis]CDJ33066.1 hypothetical protein, conserved [Eimeria mitis]